jgi:hypothetical protein
MKELSKRDKSVLFAFEKGYYVVNGIPHSPSSGKPRAVMYDKGRPYFTIRFDKNSTGKVYVYRLVAYKKFGNKIFDEDVFTYHENGDILDNNETNICIGRESKAKNHYDKAEYQKT